MGETKKEVRSHDTRMGVTPPIQFLKIMPEDSGARLEGKVHDV
jgi:hypothetical protein